MRWIDSTDQRGSCLQCDPEAAQSIFSNAELAAKTTLIPLDLTHQILATSEVQDMVLHGPDHSMNDTAPQNAKNLRKLFHDLLVFFASTYRDVFGLVDGPPLHDPIAIAVLLGDAELAFNDLGCERWHVAIVTDGRHGDNDEEQGQLGRTVISKAEYGGVRIPRGLHVKRFWELIQDALMETERLLIAEAGR